MSLITSIVQKSTLSIKRCGNNFPLTHLGHPNFRRQLKLLTLRPACLGLSVSVSVNHRQRLCASKGYVNIIYITAVGSANSQGEHANYDERCWSQMTTPFVQNLFAIPLQSVDD